MIRRALLSMADKTGLADLARGLDACGVQLIASGGTARAIAEVGIPVTPVEEITGYPSLLDGRVKTLHPAVHVGILARRAADHLDELAAHDIEPIDLVAVNLYPFRETVARADVTLEEAVEQIDIGGVALLRAAAKNFAHVTVLVDPNDYDDVLAKIQAHGGTDAGMRYRLARKAFVHTAAYDVAISSYLMTAAGTPEQVFPDLWPLILEKVYDLRYGENAHQRAAAYRIAGDTGLLAARQLHGKGLSLTNVLDLEAAWLAANDFEATTAAVIKHTNPCGLASAETLVQAYRDARASDPVSAFGGVVGLNRPVDVKTAQAIDEIFTEAVIAPGYAPEALELLQGKRDRRLLEMPADAIGPLQMHGVGGGLLVQERDEVGVAEWRAVTQREPTAEEEVALRFAWRAVKHVKSNAIVLAQGTRTVGVGAGQMSRVDAVRLAVEKAGDRSQGAVMASDAFFPFPDGVEAACRVGVTAIVQPGGSIRDNLAIEAADKYGAAMVITGMRHFRH